ncbi:class I SAM-dependent methyltransferase [Algoriphagus lacus]|uniref:Class I SAM-dependent methyltransferase n=1 Tax=Algoriphagus lacus TaxID=2056311 RepID=A0A418PUI4_9BACT|nr:class I SAM-dependent methyltransferase [Algoriphagus lacus]
MARLLFSIKSYLKYWLKKEDHYSQQSPFIFQTYNRLYNFLNENRVGDPEIEKIRKRLLKTKTKINVLDLGAGSKMVPLPTREIAEITRYSTSNPKFSQLYQFFCSLTPGEKVIELGTCVGISTRYLSKATLGKLYTFEGSEEIQKIATQNPTPERTEFILGPIEEKLPKVINEVHHVDFALIDANHTYQGTLQSFYTLLPKVHSKSIIAVGDIHWTPEMEKAWEEIKSCPQVKLTIDFFECGIVFFNYPGVKTHLILDI